MIQDKPERSLRETRGEADNFIKPFYVESSFGNPKNEFVLIRSEHSEPTENLWLSAISLGARVD